MLQHEVFLAFNSRSTATTVLWYWDTVTDVVDLHQFAVGEDISPRAAGRGVDDGTALTQANFRARFRIARNAGHNASFLLMAAHPQLHLGFMHVLTTVEHCRLL